MAPRLWFADLPNPTAVASRLSREVLISLGLTWIVAPAVVVFLGYVAWRFARSFKSFDEGRTLDERWLSTGEAWGAAFLGGLLLTLPGFLWAYFVSDFRRHLGWAVVAFAASALITFAAIRMRSGLLNVIEPVRPVPYPSPRERYRKTWPTAALIGLVWSLNTFPGFIILGAAIKFQGVLVCGAEGEIQKSGLLVGGTDDLVYVGETEYGASGDRRLLIIPFDKVDEIFVGEDAKGATCDVIRGSAPD